MTVRMRHCWVCGADIGMLDSRDYEPTDTCGAPACEREARDVARQERDEAHDQLDRDRSWR